MRLYDAVKSMFITICFLGYVFIVSGLIINFLQLCSCLIWPFSKQLYRKVNCFLALAIWSRKYLFPLWNIKWRTYPEFWKFSSVRDWRSSGEFQDRWSCLLFLLSHWDTTEKFICVHACLEFSFFAQWWSKSNSVLYINPEDVDKVRHEHAIVV